VHLDSLFSGGGGLFLLEIHFQLGIHLEIVKRIVKGQKMLFKKCLLFQSILSDTT